MPDLLNFRVAAFVRVTALARAFSSYCYVNFSFEDAQKILATMGYDLIIDFKQPTVE